MALFLYLWFDGLQSLYVVSALFGLFQGGIVPMYAVVIREYLPAKQAGVRIGLVMSVTVLGMAAGGYISGVIFDYFGLLPCRLPERTRLELRQPQRGLLADAAGAAAAVITDWPARRWPRR